MKTLALSLFISSMLFGISLNAQSTFVQFIIIGLDNETQCRMIEDSVRTHVGFESVRAESYTSNFLAVLKPGYTYSKSEMRAWLLSLGFDLYCYRTGVLGVDQTTRLKRKECDLLEQKQQE